MRLGLPVPRTRLAEVEAAEEFADEEDVCAFSDFGAKGRVVGEGAVGDGGAQVGEATEGFADLQQAGFGALAGGQCVELVVTDGTEEGGVALQGGCEGMVGQGFAVGGDGDAADGQWQELEDVAAMVGDGGDDIDGFVGHFGADAVSFEECDFEVHGSPAASQRVSGVVHMFGRRRDESCGLGDKGDDVLVVEGLLAVGERSEAGVGVVQFFGREGETEFLETVLEGAAA